MIKLANLLAGDDYVVSPMKLTVTTVVSNDLKFHLDIFWITNKKLDNIITNTNI